MSVVSAEVADPDADGALDLEEIFDAPGDEDVEAFEKRSHGNLSDVTEDYNNKRPSSLKYATSQVFDVTEDEPTDPEKNEESEVGESTGQPEFDSSDAGEEDGVYRDEEMGEQESSKEEEEVEEFEEEETSDEEEESGEDLGEYEDYKRRLINQYIETKKIHKYHLKKNAFLQDKLYKICVRKGFIVDGKNSVEEEEKPGKRRKTKKFSITAATRLAHEIEENMQEDIVDVQEDDSVNLIKREKSVLPGGGLRTFLEATLELKYNKIVRRILAAEKSKADDAIVGDSELDKIREKNERAKRIHYDKLHALMERVQSISDAAVDSNTGKRMSKWETEAFIEEVSKVHEKLVNTLQKMYNNRHGLEFALKRLQETEFQGEGLQMLEYEQLTAENYSLKDKLEDRQKDLEHIKEKIAHAVQILAHFRECMSKLKEKLDAGTNKLEQINTRVYQVRRITDAVTERYETYKGEETELVNESGLLDNMRLLRDYESTHYKNLERREEKRKLKKKLGAISRETREIHAQIKDITTNLPEIKQNLSQRSTQLDQVSQNKMSSNQLQRKTQQHKETQDLQLQWLLINRNLDPQSALNNHTCNPPKPSLKGFGSAK